MKTLAAFRSIEVESYRFTNVRWPQEPFEGTTHAALRCGANRRDESVSSWLGRSCRWPRPWDEVILNLLEPQAPDSLARWGFFNAIFEEKEYAEHYVLEALAREMMANDPALEAGVSDNCSQRIAEFAASPSARLRFFYKRSPYWDPQMNLYPVGRIISDFDLPLA